MRAFAQSEFWSIERSVLFFADRCAGRFIDFSGKLYRQKGAFTQTCESALFGISPCVFRQKPAGRQTHKTGQKGIGYRKDFEAEMECDD